MKDEKRLQRRKRLMDNKAYQTMQGLSRYMDCYYLDALIGVHTYHVAQSVFFVSGCKVNKKGGPGSRGSFCGSVSLHCARLRLAPFRGTDPQKQSIPSLPFSIGNQGVYFSISARVLILS